MIRFKKIRWKNLVSFGDTPTEVILDEGNLTAIRGRNGSGKSAFLEAIDFVLFNRPFRKINKLGLINDRNGKGLLVELWFDSDSNEYRIVRGLRPNIFEIYKDGALLDQNAASRDYQQYLESVILGIDYDTFNQIVVLGKAAYVSFMRLRLDQRRKFIESVLGLNIFALMLETHKKNLSALKSSILESKSDLALVKEKLSLQEKHLDDLVQAEHRRKEEYVRHTDEQIREIDQDIAELEAKIVSYKESIPENSNNNGLDVKLKEVESLLRKAAAKEKSLQKEIEMLKLNSCPTCGQHLEDKFKEERTARINESLGKVLDAENNLTRQSEKLISAIEEERRIREERRKIESVISDFMLEIDIKSRSRNRILTADTDRNPSLLGDQIRGLEETIRGTRVEYDECLSNRESLLNTLEKYEVVSALLGDDGIRRTTIRAFLPHINSSVNGFLDKLGFSVRFSLGEDFSEEIKIRGIQKKYMGCSEGEKEKIDLGLMLAWRDVARIRSRFSCNLIVFDEMFDSSLDITSIESLISILKGLDNTTVFVMTHSGDYASEFDKTIVVEKNSAGFSQHLRVE